jgi:molybdopterin-guanine dinucleotide biosynthesis protein A
LAGGRSRRFGSDKALFPVNGVPLARHLADVLADAGLEPWLVVREPRRLGVPELVEPAGPRHPLWGVAAALARGEDTFFTPCDLVDLRADQVRALLAARAVAVDHPLLGVYPASLAEVARQVALAGGPVRPVVAGLPSCAIGPVTNLNRPPGS